MAVRTLLLSQVANISTPPCVTVTPPVLKGVNSDPNNGAILQVTWRQLSNTGSFITGYTVFWGTVSGVYTSNSGLLPATPHQYIINGLTPGTTYFVAVVANTNIAACQSANSNEKSNTTSGAPAICNAGTTFANAWATRVVANGGVAPSQATKDAIANFQCGLITDGLDVLMFSWNAFVPDNLTAALTPQLLSATGGPGLGPGFDPFTNHNFGVGALTVNGLKGNGINAWLDTGLSCTNTGLTTTNAGMTMYHSVAATVGNASGIDNGLFTQIIVLNPGFAFFCWDSGASNLSWAATPYTGYSSGNRTALNGSAAYEANSGTPHHTSASSAVNTTGSATPQTNWFIGIFTFNNNGGQNQFSDSRMSFWAIHKGLTSAQSALFFARIQTLRQALGGGFV